MKKINEIAYHELREGNICVYGTHDPSMIITLRELTMTLNQVSQLTYRSKFQTSEFSIYLAPNREQFDFLVVNLLKINMVVPSNPKRVANPQKTELVLLCPSAYATDSVYTFDLDTYRRLLMHESVHMLHEFLLKGDMEKVSTWFAEGVAIYFSKQAKYEAGFRETVIEGIKYHKIPNLSDLEGNRKLSYDWGWTLVNYIDVIYGRDTLIRLFHNARDQFVIEQLTTEVRVFELEWRMWVQDLLNSLFSESSELR